MLYVCVSLCVCLSVCEYVYFGNYMRNLYHIFGACCLWSWLNFPLVKGVKYAICDCLVKIATLQTMK